jgi:mRNA degradation ribonuclease J1/J2
MVSMAVDETGALLGEPQVQARGIPGIDDDSGALSLLCADARAAARHARPQGLEEAVRRAVRRTVLELTGARPVIEVGIVTIP